MDEYTKNSIDLRRQNLEEYFIVPKEMQAEVEEVFAAMESLGESCRDVADFEQKLAASPLNQKYLDLFTKLKPRPAAVADAMKQSFGQMSAKEKAQMVGDVVEMEVDSRVLQPMRHQAYEERRKFLRDNVPGYETARQAADTAGLLKRLFKKDKE